MEFKIELGIDQAPLTENQAELLSFVTSKIKNMNLHDVKIVLNTVLECVDRNAVIKEV